MTMETSDTPKSFSVTVPQAEGFRTSLQRISEDAQSLTVKDKAGHERGLVLLEEIGRIEARITYAFKEPKEGAHKAYKFLCDMEGTFLTPLREAKGEVNTRLDAYEREEFARAREEALQREAEARKAEEDRQLADAEMARDAGDNATAEAILNEPLAVAPISPEPEIATRKGISARHQWRAIVTDKAALVKYAAANPQFLRLVEPCQAALNQLARAMEREMVIPGVRAVKETVRTLDRPRSTG